MHRKNCYVHLNELGIRDPHPEEATKGKIELEITYTLQSGEPTATRFSLLENISTVTLDQYQGSILSAHSAAIDKEPLQLPEPTKIFPPAVVPETSDVKLVTQTDVISLFKKFLGYVMSNEEYFALKNFLDLATAWGQGIEVSGVSLFWSFMMIQKYFKGLPM